MVNDENTYGRECSADGSVDIRVDLVLRGSISSACQSELVALPIERSMTDDDR